MRVELGSRSAPYARERTDAGLRVTDAYRSSHTGVHHVYLQQTHRSMEVVGATMTVNVGPDGSIIAGAEGPDMLGTRAVQGMVPRPERRQADDL